MFYLLKYKGSTPSNTTL